MMLQKLFVLLTLSLSAAAPLQARSADQGLAARSTQDYLIIFEKGFDTPDRLVRDVANNLKKIGAQINFEYHTVIKGFAVTLPKDLVDTVRGLNNQEYPFVLEEDKQAHTML